MTGAAPCAKRECIPVPGPMDRAFLCSDRVTQPEGVPKHAHIPEGRRCGQHAGGAAHPSQRKCRFETFCYGPKSCCLYLAGPTRKVPGRKGMSWEEEDWVDEDATSHRGPDE